MPEDGRENRGGRYRGRRSFYNEGDEYNNYSDGEGSYGVYDINRGGDPNALHGAEGTTPPPSDFDAAVNGIPFVDWITGAQGRRQAAEAAAEAETNRNYWENLNTYAPSVDDLSADLAFESEVAGPGSVWANDTAEAARGRGAMEGSLSQLEEWARGGLTATDRGMMDEAARNEAMGARADREAALSALEARGAGSSGASLAADLAAGEGAASRASAANTSLMGAAQAREYNASRDAAALGGTMRDMDARERSGLEAYNMYDTDYYRGREDRNTDRENVSRENDAEAAQQVYANRERATAGATNQYSIDAGARERAGDDEDERDGIIGEIAGELLG